MPTARKTARSTSSNRVGGSAAKRLLPDVLLVQGRNLLAPEYGGLREAALAAPQPNVRRRLREPRRARDHDDVRRQVISNVGRDDQFDTTDVTRRVPSEKLVPRPLVQRGQSPQAIGRISTAVH